MRLARLGSSGLCRTRRWSVRAWLLCSLLVVAPSADAAPPPTGVVVLRLIADADCVSEQQLRSRVASLRVRIVEASERNAQLALVAHVVPQASGGLLVTLHVDWPDGRHAERSVAASSCEASLDALALLVQMTLDAVAAPAVRQASAGRPARRAPEPATSPAQDPEAAATPAAVPARAAGAKRAAASGGAAKRSDARAGNAAVGRVGNGVARRAGSDLAGRVGSDAVGGAGGEGASAGGGLPGVWQRVSGAVAGASFGVGSGAAPELQAAVGLFAGLGLRGVGLLRPWLQIALSHAWARGISLAAGRADFTLSGGQLLLCPAGWSTAYVAAHGCGAFELASLRARGYDTYAPRAQVVSWASAGVGLLVRASIWKLELQLDGSLLHPLRRDQFSFAPDVFFSVPAWRWQLKVGVGVRFL